MRWTAITLQVILGPGTYLRITPTISWSGNLDGRPFTGEADVDRFGPRRTVHRPPSGDKELSR